MEWIGGKPMGSLNERKDQNHFVIRFLSPTLAKSICYGKCRSKEEALQLSLDYRYKEAEKRGKIWNKYRIAKDKNGNEYLEVKLEHPTGEKIMLCDLEDLPLVEKYVWRATFSNGVFYVTHSSNSAKNLKIERFHRLIFPNYKEIDHINRNGLDNRRKNLRNCDGLEFRNTQNQSKRKDNKSGKTGVHYDKHKEGYIVQWSDGKKRYSKTFCVKKCGTDIEAKNVALKLRQNLDKYFGIYNGYNVNEIDDNFSNISEEEKQEIEELMVEKKSLRGMHFNPDKKVFQVFHKYKKVCLLRVDVNVNKSGYDDAKQFAEELKLKCLNEINKKKLTLGDAKIVAKSIREEYVSKRSELYKNGKS